MGAVIHDGLVARPAPHDVERGIPIAASSRAAALEAEAEKLLKALESIAPPSLEDEDTSTGSSMSLVDEVPVGLAELRGHHFVIASANPAFVSLCAVDQRTGRAPEGAGGAGSDVEGRPLGEVAPLAFTHGVADLLSRVAATRAPGAMRAVRAWGEASGREERFVDLVAEPRGESIVLVVVDVTQHVRERRAETMRRRDAERRAALLEEERSARARAEDASRTKDEFLATLSHELRTPLNAILGWTKVLRRRRLDEDGMARALAVIERNARAQLRLVEDLLDVSRIVQGKLVLSTGPVDLAHVVRSVLETMRPSAEAKGIALAADLVDGVSILGDADRIEQALVNLVANAIKFTARGAVRIVVRAADDAAVIEVSDTGCGIAPEFLPHVFDRFRQADGGAMREAGGLGVGLAIVRSLVDLHAGRITATSDGPGRGATFTMRLPAAPPDWDEPPPSVTPPPIASASWTSGRLLDAVRVLVVDDDEDARLLAAHLLADAGADVTSAGSVREALEAAASRVFDVLVSDVGMPVETGYDLIRALRSDGDPAHAALPALAVTAYAREEDRRVALLAGFDGHLAKPVDPAQLVAAVDQARRARRGRPS